jgi:hypothetical protein
MKTAKTQEYYITMYEVEHVLAERTRQDDWGAEFGNYNPEWFAGRYFLYLSMLHTDPTAAERLLPAQIRQEAGDQLEEIVRKLFEFHVGLGWRIEMHTDPEGQVFLMPSFRGRAACGWWYPGQIPEQTKTRFNEIASAGDFSPIDGGKQEKAEQNKDQAQDQAFEKMVVNALRSRANCDQWWEAGYFSPNSVDARSFLYFCLLRAHPRAVRSLMPAKICDGAGDKLVKVIKMLFKTQVESGWGMQTKIDESNGAICLLPTYDGRPLPPWYGWVPGPLSDDAKAKLLAVAESTNQ